ncbi:MAG: hypothetical protein KAS65_05095 [Candidatus Aminicenantes bacterium]|nr:hypothetical protein [Candidatus Aminicenantes bacterium]
MNRAIPTARPRIMINEWPLCRIKFRKAIFK